MSSADSLEVPTLMQQEPLQRLLEDFMQRTAAVRGSLHAFGTTVQRGAGSQSSVSDRGATRSSIAAAPGIDCSITVALPWTSTRPGESGSSALAVMRHFAAGTRTRFEQHLELTYGGKDIGWLHLTFADRVYLERFAERQQQSIARELGLELKRHELVWMAKERLNLDLLLGGRSQALRRLESEIEKVSA